MTLLTGAGLGAIAGVGGLGGGGRDSSPRTIRPTAALAKRQFAGLEETSFLFYCD